MCFYDLQKAFDSVEYLVLFEKLYDVEERGKMFGLLKNWYTWGSELTEDSMSVFVERGVKQDSVCFS